MARAMISYQTSGSRRFGWAPQGTLDRYSGFRIGGGPLPIKAVASTAVEIAQGLAAALRQLVGLVAAAGGDPAALSLPWYYAYGFPIELALGRADAAAVGRGFALQLAWGLVGTGLLTVLWRRGVKRYTAVGG